MMSKVGWEVTVFAGSLSRDGLNLEDGITVYRVKVKTIDEFNAKVVLVFSNIHAQLKFDCFETPEIHGHALTIAAQHPEIPFVTRLHTNLELQTSLMNYYKPINQKLRYVLGALRRGRIDLGYWRKLGAKKIDSADYRMAMLATAISSPSEAMKNWTVRYWLLNPNKIIVLPNVFSPSFALRTQHYSTNRKLLTFIGKINIQKGMKEFMHALPRILKNCPHVDVCLIGPDWQGPGGEVSMRQIMERKLAKWKSRIQFTGSISREETDLYLSKSLACIFPSIWEAFGYVALEAMSAGVPVIVGRGSGFEEITESGRYGVNVNPLSSSDIATKTTALLHDKNRLDELSVLGRCRVLDFYSHQALAEPHAAFYKKVISSCV